MKKTYGFILLALPFIFFSGCEKNFIEKDLTGKTITVIAPSDGDTVITTTPIFWWNKIDGALDYRVQIAWPDFSAPQVLYYDTAVDGDRFYPSLTAGSTYAWRIRPENGSSAGDWITRMLTVDSSVSLNSQLVIITSPATNNYATSNSTVAFTWDNVTSAGLYRIEVTDNSSSSQVVNTTTTINSYTSTFAEGNYTFSVRAENATSFTPWSNLTFSVDQTAPSAPVLVSPATGTIYTTPPVPLSLDWTDAGDALTDSLYIGTDSTFSTGVQVAILLNATQSSYSWMGAQAATAYFWRVRSMDAAGNRSNYSTTFKFTDN